MTGTGSNQEQARTILAVAPNGSRRGKADHPGIPLTSGEILREAAGWCDAGASVLHLHVRDRDGRHSLDADAYIDLFKALREVVGPGPVLQMTTESGGIFARDAQIAALRAVRPEAVSIGLREIAPGEADREAFAELMAWMTKERIAPQIILYDRADLNRLTAWAREGVVDAGALSVLLVLGRYSADERSYPVDLLGFLGVETLPFRDWMMCAFGPNESRCAALAALLGGHVRAGFENNVYLPSGDVAENNAELIAATAAMLKALHVSLAAPADVRALWRIG